MMNKQQFEAADGGIRKGDLVIVTKLNDAGWAVAYVGRYDPIEDHEHRYVQSVKQHPNLQERLINTGYTLLRDPAFNPQSPQRGVFDMQSSFEVQIQYARTLSVRRLMESSAMEEFVSRTPDKS